MNMKRIYQKIFEHTDSQVLDTMCNEYKKNNTVVATHFNAVVLADGRLLHICVLYYEVWEK